MKVCIIATENYLYDSRMYWKEACSLKNHGYSVTCIVMSDISKEEMGITEHGIEYFKFRLYPNELFNVVNRPLFYEHTFSRKTFDRIFEVASTKKFDIYHLHGLYSLMFVNKLKKINNKSKIIYEDREFYPDAIRDYNITKGFKTVNKNLYSYYMDLWERYNAAKCDHIITTDRFIANRFKSKFLNKNVDIVYNFTNIKPIKEVDYNKKVYDMIYCGVVTKVRGIMQLLQSVQIGKKYKRDIKLLIIGSIENSLHNEMLNFIKKNELDNNVKLLGRIDFSQLPYYLEKSKVGMVTLLPIPKYKKNIPMKQFEYMAYGLPVVGSNLPPISEFTGKSNCGILVNPLKPEEIWHAVDKILNDINLYKVYSNNGINMVKTKYNWRISEERLINIYINLLSMGGKNE